jgi:glycosyltransferase involved in cell wall biosynthesis
MNAYWQTRDDKIHEIERRSAFCMNALNGADLIISRSKFLESVYAQAGVAQEKMVFCRQGFEGVASIKQRPPTAVGATPILRVIYLGQITKHKGVHTLLEAVRRRPQAKVEVSIYGDLERFPSYVEKLRSIADHDPRIHINGLAQPEEISALLKESDVLVVPSIWYENSPNTIAEAFAHGVPVIASNLGGMAELIKHEQNGLVFNPGDADDLAYQLLRLLEEPNLLTELQNGIEPVKTVSDEIHELETFYRGLRRTLSSQREVVAV